MMVDVLLHFGLAELLVKASPLIFHVSSISVIFFFSVVFLNIQGLVSLCAAELEYRGLAAWLKLWSMKLFYYESIQDFAVWWGTEVFRELTQAKYFIAYSSVNRQGQAWSVPVSHIPAAS